MRKPDTIERQLVTAGMTPGGAADKARLFHLIEGDLEQEKSGSEGPYALFIPGRIEFLGKHTDYAGGRSLLCTVERGICLQARSRPDRQITIRDAVHRLEASFEISPDLAPLYGTWASYGMVVARRIARNFSGSLRGADISFASDLSPAAGMSTSSALITGIFLALAHANQLPRHPAYASHITSSSALAEYLGAIENGSTFQALGGDSGVGTFGGSQDHAAILLSQPGQLVECSFAPVRRESVVPLPADCTFAVAVSGVIAEKTGAAREPYNRMARVTRTILERWNRLTGRTDPTLIAAIDSSQDAHQHLREMLETGRELEFDHGAMLARLEQLVMESTVLIPDAIDALRRQDAAALGATVDISQMLAERMLENQVPETAALARLARGLGAVAASAFGAGFGGSVWALTRENEAEDFLTRWKQAYTEVVSDRSGTADFFLSRAGPPLTELSFRP
jgi:galactokinase